jgi:hypothetical protein
MLEIENLKMKSNSSCSCCFSWQWCDVLQLTVIEACCSNIRTQSAAKHKYRGRGLPFLFFLASITRRRLTREEVKVVWQILLLGYQCHCNHWNFLILKCFHINGLINYYESISVYILMWYQKQFPRIDNE